jgi:hypothetical protein
MTVPTIERPDIIVEDADKLEEMMFAEEVKVSGAPGH